MKNILVLLFLVSVLVIFGADIETQLAQEKMRLGDLVVGQGLADTLEEADQLALQDLTSQIVVTVKSSFVDRAKEDGVSVEEYCERVVKTYSEVELVGATKLSGKEGKQCKVYRFITVSNKEKIFRDRKSQIINLVVEGEMALSKSNLTDALRNYYWALLLLKSHPDSKTMTYYFGTQERILEIALPAEMESILAKIKIDLVSISTKENANCSELVLEASSNGKKVGGLLVNFHDGYRWSQPTKWTNGTEFITLNNTTLTNQKKLIFKIDYTFANHSFIKDIDSAIGNIPLIELKYAEKEVLLTKREMKKHTQKSEKLFTFDKSVKKANETAINNILTAICDKDLVRVRRDFTASGFQQFNSLMGYGNAVIIPTKTSIKQVNIAHNEVLRSVPMKFNFSSSNEDFTEKVNFIFDKEGKVDGVSFALSHQACSDIVDKDFATDAEKAIIINFIEQYKTAYCLKDLDFIKDVFSNDALIIVGKMVKAEPDKVNDMLYGQLNKTTVKYVKLNKTQYIDRLSAQFDRNDFINIHFSDNSIDRVESDSSKVFGIQIAQYYYSSNYSDAGYLFLMFDLHDIKSPKIMVRSWQPEKSEDGSIIGLEEFEWE